MAYPRRSMWPPVLELAAGTLFILVWLSIPLGFAVILLTEAEALENRGVDVEGTVTRLWTEESDGSTRYLGSYAFVAGNGEFVGEARVDEDQWVRLEIGGKVLVRYAQDDPRVSGTLFRRDLNEKDGGRSIGAVIVLVFTSAGFAFLVGIGFSLNKVRRQFWLRDHGVMRTATVLSSEMNEGSWDIAWRDVSGVDGRSSGIAEKIRPLVGATITVFAHPTKHWATVWEGDVGSRVETS